MSDEMVWNYTEEDSELSITVKYSRGLVFKITSWITGGIKWGGNAFYVPIILKKKMLEVKQRWFGNYLGSWRIKEKIISCIIYQVWNWGENLTLQEGIA